MQNSKLTPNQISALNIIKNHQKIHSQNELYQEYFQVFDRNWDDSADIDTHIKMLSTLTDMLKTIKPLIP